MEAGEHPEIPTPLLMLLVFGVHIFNNYFLADLQADSTATGIIFLWVGYFVEIATFMLVLIRLYENREYAVKIWRKILQYWKYLKMKL